MTYKTLDSVMQKHRDTAEYQQEYDKIRHQMAILQAIIDLRKEMGLSQTELAEMVGKEQHTIACIESGDYTPNLKTLYQIANATGKKLEVRFV